MEQEVKLCLKCGHLMHRLKSGYWGCRHCINERVKAYYKTEKGKAALKVQQDRYRRRKFRTLLDLPDKKYLAPAELNDLFRRFMRDYLKCWQKEPSGGYVVYKERLPDLQRLRQQAGRLLEYKTLARLNRQDK